MIENRDVAKLCKYAGVIFLFVTVGLDKFWPHYYWEWSLFIIGLLLPITGLVLAKRISRHGDAPEYVKQANTHSLKKSILKISAVVVLGYLVVPVFLRLLAGMATDVGISIGGNYYRKGGKIIYTPAPFEVSAAEVFGADAKTFKVISYCDNPTNCDLIAQDANYIYAEARPLLKVDRNTYQVLGYGYSKDKNFVYYRTTPLPGADGSTFVVISHFLKFDHRGNSLAMTSNLGDNYAKDKSGVYFGYKPVEKADPATFTVLNLHYSHDKAHVFFDGVEIPGADAATFRILCDEPTAVECVYEGDRGQDKNFKYSEQQIISELNNPSAKLSVPRGDGANSPLLTLENWKQYAPKSAALLQIGNESVDLHFNHDVPNEKIHFSALSLDSATGLPLSDSLRGFEADFPYNQKWGINNYRVMPYEITDNDTANTHIIDFGPIIQNIGGISWEPLRAYRLRVYPPLQEAAVDAMIAHDKTSGIFGFSEKRVVNGLTVVVRKQTEPSYTDDAPDCPDNKIMEEYDVISSKHTYAFSSQCAGPDDDRILWGVVGSFKVIN